MSRGDAGGPLGPGPEPAQLGRYRLLRKIAVGGMAEIYLARVSGPGGFEKDVVVKRILPQLAESDECFAMFLDEARIAATLQHPNVVQIFDAGLAGTEFFIAMEYLDGADLHTVRRVLAEREAGLPLQHALFIVSSIAAGLHYAHEKLDLGGQPLDIVHRDVTPHNVFLTREGGVKLVDFGIAKATNRMCRTSYGTLKGKLGYMSPEQCRAEPVDRRSDIYSLGILLYELTTGHRPYRGRSEYELLREIVEGVVPPPSESIPDYPADLEEITMRALARDRADRHPNALVFVQELEQFARRHALVGSTLAMVEFLTPILDEAQRQSAARQRKRMSTAPPIAEDGAQVDAGAWAETEADRRQTVAAAPGRRPSSPRPISEPVPDDGPSAPAAGFAGGDPVAPLAPATEMRAPAARFAEETPRASALGNLATAAARALAVEPAVPAAPHFTARLPRPGSRTGRVRLEGAGPAAPLPIATTRPRSRRAASLVAALVLLAAGSGAAILHYRRDDDRRARDDAAGTIAQPVVPARPATLRVSSDPPGAAVWLALGPSPAAAEGIDPGRPHLVRVEHDGYRSRELWVAPEAFHPGDPAVAELLVQLEATGPRRPRLAEPAALPDRRPGAESRSGRLRVASQPAAATVWLLVGVTPARIPPLLGKRAHELRVARDGYLPAFAVASAASIAAGGETEIAVPLVQRTEPEARRVPPPQARRFGPPWH